MLVEKFGDNVFPLGCQAHWLERDQQAVLLSLATYGSRQRSSAMRNGIFGARFGRVTRVSVAPENGACYVKTFLDRYHTEEQLVYKAGPQTCVPLTGKHRND